MIIRTFEIQYLPSGVIQAKKLLAKDYSDKVKENMKKYVFLLKTESVKSADKFESENKCKFDYDEVCLDSPMGIAINNAHQNDIVEMTLPRHQGGIHKIKILKIQ